MSNPSGFLRYTRALYAAAAKSTTPISKPTVSVPKPTKKVTAPSGIQKPTPISPLLQSVVGAPEISRAEAMKKIWEYIKLHNLQNPSDKREIMCDAKLKKLFGKDKVGFLEIARLISPHIIKAA